MNNIIQTQFNESSTCTPNQITLETNIDFYRNQLETIDERIKKDFTDFEGI